MRDNFLKLAEPNCTACILLQNVYLHDTYIKPQCHCLCLRSTDRHNSSLFCVSSQFCKQCCAVVKAEISKSLANYTCWLFALQAKRSLFTCTASKHLNCTLTYHLQTVSCIFMKRQERDGRTLSNVCNGKLFNTCRMFDDIEADLCATRW